MKTVLVVFDQPTVNLPYSVYKHLQNKSQSLRRAIFPALARIKCGIGNIVLTGSSRYKGRVEDRNTSLITLINRRRSKVHSN